jgi:metal-responsive CopG/Arc/MetJ family transcriptional regulator
MARLFINLSEELLGKVKYAALQENRNPSDLIENIIRGYFDEDHYDDVLEMETARNFPTKEA